MNLTKPAMTEDLSAICKLSGLIKANSKNTDNGNYYDIKLDDTTLEIRFCRNCFKKPEVIENRDVILSLLLNGKIYKTHSELLHWDDEEDDSSRVNLKKLVKSGVYPRTPKEKLENLFKELFIMQSYDGESISTLSNFFTERRARSLYFRNKNEFVHYTKALAEQGNIEIIENKEAGYISSFRFTFAGLNNYIELFEKGYNSKNCFIAMSFDNDNSQIMTIRNAIKEAIVETGYNPIIVDEKYFNSDKTIVDEMIKLIRDCKFCISDFAQNKNGVYFESGFALGLGKPVIYTCPKEELGNVHFDLQQLQHIVYKTPENLKSALINKIKAWIPQA